MQNKIKYSVWGTTVPKIMGRIMAGTLTAKKQMRPRINILEYDAV